jgi:catechol 2,3-dioxygenase-like lactoylglutathione lyase family enzyme
MNVYDIRPFIPAKDYSQSQAFYRALGFEVEKVNEDLSLCTKGPCTFFLRRFYQADFAANSMYQLIVTDIHDAFITIKNLTGFDIKYEPIQHEHWGSIVYLWGPAGELWHVTQLAHQP